MQLYVFQLCVLRFHFKKVELSKLPAFSIGIFSELYLLHSNEEKGLCNPISNHLGESRRSGNRSDLGHGHSHLSNFTSFPPELH